MARKTLGDAPLAAWKSLLNAHAVAVGAIEARLRDANEIPLAWYDVLWSLRKAEGDCCLRFRKLQDEIVLSRSALSRLVDGLAKVGLVKKQACEKDGRGVDVALTDKGRKALASAWPLYSEGIAAHFARQLTVTECEQITKILGKVAEPAPTGRDA